MSDTKLRTLLGELLTLADTHGTRSEEVRKIILDNAEVDEFQELGALLMVLIEREQEDE